VVRAVVVVVPVVMVVMVVMRLVIGRIVGAVPGLGDAHAAGRADAEGQHRRGHGELALDVRHAGSLARSGSRFPWEIGPASDRDRATVTTARNRLDVAARASAGRFKYLQVSVLHAFTVRGRERDLFEHSFVLRVRNRSGKVVGQQAMTATGAWRARIAYRVVAGQPGTLEAVADSAKDGSLACLAQVRVTLGP
jgi:Immunoglobulin-like domain of bacterial spore germination